jgi:hypothetical protein
MRGQKKDLRKRTRGSKNMAIGIGDGDGYLDGRCVASFL